MENPKTVQQLSEFEKRAVLLLAHKFIHLWEGLSKMNLGEEPEHCYEVWSAKVILDKSLRAITWRTIMLLMLL